MTFKWAELMAMSDDELIERYDAQSSSTMTGTGLLRDELLRRELRRSAHAANRMAIVNTVLAGVAAVGAVVALFLV